MHPELLQFLACPKCGGDLRVTQGALEDGHVEEGELTCLSCEGRYRVTNGIPRMIAMLDAADDRGAGDRVDLTVSQYSAYQGEVYAPLAESLENVSILEARTGLAQSDFGDKVCLDAGCGIGRFSRVMARSGARRVIALDAGESIDAAKMQTDPDLPVSFVQGHILELPLKIGSVDRAISIGVLHHTANPEKGFQSIAKAVTEDGSLSVYLYNQPYMSWSKFKRVPFWQIRYALWSEPMRRLIVRLPNKVRLAFCALLYRIRISVLEPLLRGGKPARTLGKALQLFMLPDVYKPLENPDSNIARNFDAYSTPYNYSHELEELVDWFAGQPGFNKLHVTPYRLSITGFKSRSVSPDEPLQITFHRTQSISSLEAKGVEFQSPL